MFMSVSTGAGVSTKVTGDGQVTRGVTSLMRKSLRLRCWAR
jgi:hypothetical protein